MTSAQKWIAVAGLVAIAATSFRAPYRWRGHNSIEYLIDRRPAPESEMGTTYAPLWDPPDSRNGLIGPLWLIRETRTGEELDDLQLESGKLGLWWGAIAAVTVVAMVLSAPGQRASVQGEQPRDYTLSTRATSRR